MTDTSPDAERTATVLSQSIELAITHQPDAPNRWGAGRLRPERVVFYYLNDRINAHLWGVWVREDGEVTDAPVDQLYRFDDDWPDWLTELAAAHDPREKPAIAWTPDVLEAFWAAAKRANGAPATDPAAPELTAEEARDLADELGTELYRAQDALAFVEECCVIADREGRQPTTADVREWLKGARCGRQLLADAREQTASVDRIAEILTPFFANFSDESAARANAGEAAAALAAALPASVDRADVLREAADGFDRHAAQLLNGVGDKAVFVAKALRDQAAVWSEAAETLRRLAAETRNTTETTSLKRAHVALAEQAGRDQAAVFRVRQLHDSLAEDTDLHGPEDLITRGSATRRIATALDGWNPDGLPQCPVEFENGAHCAKPAGHRRPGSDDPHVPATPPAGGAPQPKQGA